MKLMPSYEFARPVPPSSQQKSFNPAAMSTRTPNSAQPTTNGSELGINADLGN